MIRCGIIGVPGAGKTSLTRSIAAQCRYVPKLKHIELIQEYARLYLTKYGSISSIFEQYHILEKQLEFEDRVCNSALDLILTDSPIFQGFLYCCELPKSNSKEILFFNNIFKKMVKLNFPTPRYNIIFHLSPIIKPVNDGIRPELHFNEAWRSNADMMLRSLMMIFKPIEFYIIEESDMEKRTAFCIGKIKEYLEKVQSCG